MTPATPLPTKAFVAPGHIVRYIWSQPEHIFFLFAASAAEFAYHPSVDWLYFTGKLPADPIGRMFSTLSYARGIVFANEEKAIQTISHIRQIHQNVETKRGDLIPDWAYRDVLFMLIDYSIRSYESLRHPLSHLDKQEVYDVFFRIGKSMQISNLPVDYTAFVYERACSLQKHLEPSAYTSDLFRQYRKHLGWFRYFCMLNVEQLVCHPILRQKFHQHPIIVPHLSFMIYKFSRLLGLKNCLLQWLIPKAYRSLFHQIKTS